MKLQTDDPEICSMLIFQKGSWPSFSTIFFVCMIFQEKHFSSYILLTDQISLSDWLCDM